MATAFPYLRRGSSRHSPQHARAIEQPVIINLSSRPRQPRTEAGERREIAHQYRNLVEDYGKEIGENRELSQAIERLHGQCERLRQAYDDLSASSQQTQLERREDTPNAELSNQNSTLQHENAELIVARDELREKVRELEERETRLSRELKQVRSATSSALRSAGLSVTPKATPIPRQIEILTSHIEYLEADNESLVDENERLEQENERLKEDKDRLTQANREHSSSIRSLLEELQSTIQRAKERSSSMERHLRALLPFFSGHDMLDDRKRSLRRGRRSSSRATLGTRSASHATASLHRADSGYYQGAATSNVNDGDEREVDMHRGRG